MSIIILFSILQWVVVMDGCMLIIDEHLLTRYLFPGFNNNNNNVLPITQNLEGSCPVVSQVPLSQCGGRTSDCWSVGQPDVDCIDNALCCFDGCANVCQGSGL